MIVVPVILHAVAVEEQLVLHVLDALVPLLVEQSTEQSDAIVLTLHDDVEEAEDVLEDDDVPVVVAVESAELVGCGDGWSLFGGTGVGCKSLPIFIVGQFTCGKGGGVGGGNMPGKPIPNRKNPPLSRPGGQKKQPGPPLMKGYNPRV